MFPVRLTVVLAASIALLAACSGPRREPGSEAKRIVAVAPSIVELLFELGLEERIVAVGDHCFWPPEVMGKPRIGGLLDPRLERIAALEPDLAILLPSEQTLARSLDALGIEVLTTPAETIEDIERAVVAIAERTDTVAAGRQLLETLRAGLVPRAVAPGTGVLLVVGRQPGSLTEIYAAGGETFLSELIGRLGAVNVLADSPLLYPQIGLEEVVMRRPAVVVELQPEMLSESARRQLRADWERRMPGPAPCVSIVEGSHVLLPGPRLGVLFRQLGEALTTCEERP